MSDTARNLSMGCARSMTLQILIPIIVLPLGCIFVLAPLWLVMSFDLNPVWLIVPLILFFLIVFGGTAAAMAWVLYSRARKLDAAFVPLGLAGSLYMLWFRQYHGTVGGRQMDVYLKRGPYLDIYVGTPVKSRMGITSRNWDTQMLGTLVGKSALTFADSRLDGLSVYAWEEGWTREVVARPNVAGLLRRLIEMPGFWIRRQVILSPGALRLSLSGSTTLFRFEIQPEEARRWVGDLVALAEIVERAPGPQIVIEETEGERLARSVRNQNPYLLPIIAVAVIIGILLCTIVPGIMAYLWAISSRP